MARHLFIEITESAKTLEKQLKHSRSASDKERLQMLWWLKTQQVTQHQELARRLGRNPSTITRWLTKYRQGGLTKLLEVKKAPGKTPHLTPEALLGLTRRLQTQGFKSYGEIVEWVNKTYNLEVKYATVYHWVRYRLKAKLKVPRPQSAEFDPEAYECFKKTLVWHY